MSKTWLQHFNKNVFDINKNLRSSSQNMPPINLLEQKLPYMEGLKARQEIKSWKNYQATPLRELDQVADELGVSRIWLKDESSRFGLGSFKALGGAYAVYYVLSKLIFEETGEKDLTSTRLRSGEFGEILENVTVVTATDGNHGKSVAWGAQQFGCKCKIYLHAEVSQMREEAIAAFDCDIIRVDGNYDDSVRHADKDAHKNGWHVVSDTSYEGYRKIPSLVMQGYTTIATEIAEQIADIQPTHLFLPGGVGGIAAAVSSEFCRIWKNLRPTTIIVEPKTADCLYQSSLSGQPTISSGNLHTVMACLSAGEVSILAWEILEKTANFFVRLSDSTIAPAMKRLSFENIISGESGAATLAAFTAICSDEKAKELVKIDQDSRILLISTEGATDPQIYMKLVGKKATEIITSHQK